MKTRAAIVEEMHALVRERLFGRGPWLMDIVANKQIHRKLLEDWKLEIDCIGGGVGGTTSEEVVELLLASEEVELLLADVPVPAKKKNRYLVSTPLGSELHVEMMMVFAGHWDCGEIPSVLQERGLISKDEMRDVYDRWEDGEDIEELLLPLARRAYKAFMQAPELYSK